MGIKVNNSLCAINRHQNTFYSTKTPFIYQEYATPHDMGDQKFIAFVTKGLEQISETEIKRAFYSVEILDLSSKYVIFSAGFLNPKVLLSLKTIDDVHILIALFKHIQNLDEDYITNNLPISAVNDAVNFIKNLREVNNTFSITISKYMNDIIDVETLKTKIADRIVESTKRTYTERNHSNLDIRIHIESSNVFFSCRIPSSSLYVRRYRQCEREGSLKPTIAAALCMLLNPKKGARLVDNLCGSGTILCEAKLQGLEPYGGDIDEGAVFCAKTNLKSVSPDSVNNIRLLDAFSSKWQDKYFDYAVSNYPWGKQIPLVKATKLYSESIKEYARILKDTGSIVLLSMDPKVIAKHLKKNFPKHEIVQFKIGFLGQMPWISYAKPFNTV